MKCVFFESVSGLKKKNNKKDILHINKKRFFTFNNVS